MTHPTYLHVRHPFISEQAQREFEHRHALHEFNLSAVWCDTMQTLFVFEQRRHGEHREPLPVNQAIIIADRCFKVSLRAFPEAAGKPRVLVGLLASSKEGDRFESASLARIRDFYLYAGTHGRFVDESLSASDPPTARAIASPLFHALLDIGCKPCDVYIVFEGKLAG